MLQIFQHYHFIYTLKYIAIRENEVYNCIVYKVLFLISEFNELENNNTEANNNWSAIIITLHNMYQQDFGDDMCLPMAKLVN